MTKFVKLISVSDGVIRFYRVDTIDIITVKNVENDPDSDTKRFHVDISFNWENDTIMSNREGYMIDTEDFKRLIS